MQSLGKSSASGRAGDESLQNRAGHGGKDAVMCSSCGWLPLSLSPVCSLSLSLSPSSPPGRLSNHEEMLGLSQCRPEEQMCGLEVVRQRRNGNQI